MIKLLTVFAPIILKVIEMFSSSKSAASENKKSFIEYIEKSIDKQKMSIDAKDSAKRQRIELQKLRLERLKKEAEK